VQTNVQHGVFSSQEKHTQSICAQNSADNEQMYNLDIYVNQVLLFSM